MCGIVGYVGPRPSLEVLLAGLKRLEYRGYDSAGVALALEGGIRVVKSKGRLAELRKRLAVEALARSLEAMKTRRPSWGLVFAAMGDKEIAPSLRRLAPLFETLWCTTVPRCPRAMAADALALAGR